MQPVHMAGEMRRQSDAVDFLPAQGVLAEVERLVEPDVDLARGAKRRHVAQQFFRNPQQARVQRADLAAGERRAILRAQLVEFAQLRHLDQVLGVAEQVDDGHNLDAHARGGVHEARKLFVGIGIAPGHAGQAGKLDGVLEVDVQLLVAPVGVAGQLREQPVEPLHLAGEVPLEGAGRGKGGGHIRGLAGS